MSENREIYTAGKNFTLPPAVTAWTNSTSEASLTRPAVKMPIMGPLTTPPMTIAASSIPGRYLEMRGWGLAIGNLASFKCFENLITKVTPKVTAPKKSANILVRNAWMEKA